MSSCERIVIFITLNSDVRPVYSIYNILGMHETNGSTVYHAVVCRLVCVNSSAQSPRRLTCIYRDVKRTIIIIIISIYYYIRTEEKKVRYTKRSIYHLPTASDPFFPEPLGCCRCTFSSSVLSFPLKIVCPKYIQVNTLLLYTFTYIPYITRV